MVASKHFRETLLPSNLSVLTEKVPYVRSVALGFWVKVGSKFELNEQSGISHFLEHLIFKGSKKYPAHKISAIFDSLGGEFNAFTGKEYTCFYARLLDEHVALALEILSDILQNPLFSQNDIKSEKQVILEEISLYEDTPDEKIHDLFISSLWENHPLGKSILGKKEIIKKITRKEVQDFFSKYYLPDNLSIVAAGAIDHEKLISMIQDNFYLNSSATKVDKFNSQDQLKVDTSFVPPVVTGSKVRSKIHFKKTEQAHICYGTQVFKANHPDRFALAILDTILGGGMSSRLFQEIREKRGLAYSIYSYHTLFSEKGLIAIYAGTHPSKAKEVLDLIKKEILKISSKRIKKEELKKAKDHLKGQLILSNENTTSRMMRLGRAKISEGEILSVDELIKRIDEVTSDDVLRLAQEFLNPEKMVLTIIGPLKKNQLSNFL